MAGGRGREGGGSRKKTGAADHALPTHQEGREAEDAVADTLEVVEMLLAITPNGEAMRGRPLWRS